MDEFELAMDIIRNLEYAPLGYSEELKSKQLRTLLNRGGVACSMNVSGRGADILGRNFVIEAKNDLESETVLHILKGQIDGYVSRDGVTKVCVVVYGGAKQRLLDDLRRYVSNFLLADIRVQVMGKVVRGTETVRPSPGRDTTWLFS